MSDDDLRVFNAFLALHPDRLAAVMAWLDAALPAEPLPDWGVRMLAELRAWPTATSGPGQAPWSES